MWLRIDNTFINRRYITHLDMRGVSPTELYVKVHADALSGGYIEVGPVGSDEEAFELMGAIANGTYGSNA